MMDAATFERWWKRRDLPNDREVVGQVIAAGLVREAGGMLSLTETGKKLRRGGETLRSAHKPRSDMPGRHCAICGKPGGTGMAAALRVLGYDRTATHAHGPCVSAVQRKNRSAR